MNWESFLIDLLTINNTIQRDSLTLSYYQESFHQSQEMMN